MRKSTSGVYDCLGSWLIIISIFSASVKGETPQEKINLVCKQKVLWKMKVCPAGKLVCSKNKEYVDKAKRYIKALSWGSSIRKIKASYKLMKIAPYILPWLKREYKKVKNFEQKNALFIYKAINLLKDVEIKIMCNDGRGSFMWYAVISKGDTVGPTGPMNTGFILVGNEKGVIGSVQVRSRIDNWWVNNYSCNRRNGNWNRFAIEIGASEDIVRRIKMETFVFTDNWYYKDSRIYPSSSRNFYILGIRDKRTGMMKLVMDGKKSKEYKEVLQLEFTPDDSKYGLLVRKTNGNEVAIIEGNESKEYGQVYKLVFSYSGTRYGFVGQKGFGREVAVIDGKESEEYNRIWQIAFDSSGSRVGFLARKNNGKDVAVIDGKESKEYNGVWGLTFSSSGKRYAMGVQKDNGRWVAIIDGKESEEYNTVFGFTFSPSDTRYSFWARKMISDKYVAVIDGVESKEYEEIENVGNRWGAWSSNDKLFVFVSRMRGEFYDVCEIVVNGQTLKTTTCSPGFYFHKNTLKFIEFRNNKIYKVSCR